MSRRRSGSFLRTRLEGGGKQRQAGTRENLRFRVAATLQHTYPRFHEMMRTHGCSRFVRISLSRAAAWRPIDKGSTT